MRISDENWTVVVQKFGNPTPFDFHLAHSVMKLKYDYREGEWASLTKAWVREGEGASVWEGERDEGSRFEGGRRSRWGSPRPVVRFGDFMNGWNLMDELKIGTIFSKAIQWTEVPLVNVELYTSSLHH
ncbi:hypothetical protein AVEN_73993-1 [Araneus ventricosus]|uniref:Uncharacterized protein n=1 Tax=Araneus ventricosus TaxID=182803 RepID=A0A4Y2ID61_ARAVE|nr:hypothetical protein AVEN_73993-1 [Araneus ventricosus]